MDKKIYFIIALAIIVIGGMAFFILRDNKQAAITESNASMILFFGKGCPHCENVDKFIQENNVKEKVKFDELEVFFDKSNEKLMEEKAKDCGVSTDNLGVPFLWNEGKCFSGDVDIINFFKSQIGQ